jgi:hypothetical protein
VGGGGRKPILAGAGFALLLLLLGIALGAISYGACNENVDSATTRGTICGTVASAGGRWALLMLPPLAVAIAGFVVDEARDVRRLAVALIAVDAVVFVVVVGGAL